MHADAEPLAGGAAVAVGRDHVLRAHGTFGPGPEIVDDRRDTVRVLRQRCAFGLVTEPRAEFLGPGPEYRLQRVLVDEQPDRGAELIHPGVEVREVVRDLPAGQRLDVVDPAVRRVLLFRLPADGVLEPHRAQDLHGPQVEMAGPGVDCRPGVPLDRQHVDSVPAQEQRGRQANQAAAHDQDGHILAGFAIHPETSRPSRRDGVPDARQAATIRQSDLVNIDHC